MGLLFPAIITRLDAYLHAYDVCNLLDAKIDLDVALEAITKDSDNTSESTEEQVQKRRGMGNNYERLEFLGGRSYIRRVPVIDSRLANHDPSRLFPEVEHNYKSFRTKPRERRV